MYSHMERYSIDVNGCIVPVIATARRMDNDLNGNPRFKIHIWGIVSQSIWSPKIKGFKRCKDDGYVLKGYDTLPDMMKQFIETFEESLNEL